MADLKNPCDVCQGNGTLRVPVPGGAVINQTCPACKGTCEQPSYPVGCGVEPLDALTAADRLYALATLFPSLQECPEVGRYGLDGGAWVDAFAMWAGERDRGEGAMWAALFVLSVWNDRTDWAKFGVGLAGLQRGKARSRERTIQQGRFIMHRALACWDRSHRTAFGLWAQHPWWC